MNLQHTLKVKVKDWLSNQDGFHNKKKLRAKLHPLHWLLIHRRATPDLSPSVEITISLFPFIHLGRERPCVKVQCRGSSACIIRSNMYNRELKQTTNAMANYESVAKQNEGVKIFKNSSARAL